LSGQARAGGRAERGGREGGRAAGRGWTVAGRRRKDLPHARAGVATRAGRRVAGERAAGGRAVGGRPRPSGDGSGREVICGRRW
jgi:hypothetical protein